MASGETGNDVMTGAISFITDEGNFVGHNFFINLISISKMTFKW